MKNENPPNTLPSFLKHPSVPAYFTLWLLGGISSFIAFTELGERLFPGPQGAPTKLLVFGFLLITVFHQGFIYWDVHQMEAKPREYRDDLDGWLGSRTEVLLRILIFLSVLFCAGKFLPGFEIVEHFAQDHSVPNRHTHVFICGLNWPQFSLVSGSIILFAFNVVWNVFAYARRTEPPRSTAKSALSRFLDDKLNVYTICDALALLFWISVPAVLDHIPYVDFDFVKYIASSYIIVWIVRLLDITRQEAEGPTTHTRSSAAST